MPSAVSLFLPAHFSFHPASQSSASQPDSDSGYHSHCHHASSFSLCSRVPPPSPFTSRTGHLHHRTSLFFLFTLQTVFLMERKLCRGRRKDATSYLAHQEKDVPLIGFGPPPQLQTKRQLSRCYMTALPG